MFRRSRVLPFALVPISALLLLLFAATAQSATSVVYDSINNPLPPNVVSQGFQATQTAELGDDIMLSSDDGYLSSVTVTMSNWAKQSDWPAVGDSSGYSHPITLNIYEVDTPGPNPALGDLITPEYIRMYLSEPNCRDH